MKFVKENSENDVFQSDQPDDDNTVPPYWFMTCEISHGSERTLQFEAVFITDRATRNMLFFSFSKFSILSVPA